MSKKACLTKKNLSLLKKYVEEDDLSVGEIIEKIEFQNKPLDPAKFIKKKIREKKFERPSKAKDFNEKGMARINSEPPNMSSIKSDLSNRNNRNNDGTKKVISVDEFLGKKKSHLAKYKKTKYYDGQVVLTFPIVLGAKMHGTYNSSKQAIEIFYDFKEFQGSVDDEENANSIIEARTLYRNKFGNKKPEINENDVEQIKDNNNHSMVGFEEPVTFDVPVEENFDESKDIVCLTSVKLQQNFLYYDLLGGAKKKKLHNLRTQESTKKLFKIN